MSVLFYGNSVRSWISPPRKLTVRFWSIICDLKGNGRGKSQGKFSYNLVLSYLRLEGISDFEGKVPLRSSYFMHITLYKVV